MRVDVWSDVVCPWCAIGRKRLKDALARAGLADALVVHRAFELDPNRAVSEGSLAYLTRKYGPRAPQLMDHVKAVAAADGIELDPHAAISARTFDAHRLLLWAQETQGPGAEARLMDALVAAHFREALDISTPDVLLQAVRQAGLDVDAARGSLEQQTFADEVRKDEAIAREVGVTGVPFFVLDGKLAFSGAQPPEVFDGAINEALSLAGKGPTP